MNEAEWRATLPARMAKAADDLNAVFPMPDGMRFEWGPRQPEPPSLAGQAAGALRNRAPGDQPTAAGFLVPPVPTLAELAEKLSEGKPADQMLISDPVSFLVPPAFLDDMADYAGMGELLARALRGEIEFNPPPEPARHRCLWCWLASKLSRSHDRCPHGWLESGCDCRDE